MYFSPLVALLALVPGVLAAKPTKDTDYLNDPALKQAAADSNGALKPITNFISRSRQHALTGPQGTSLHDFASAAPRANGPYLDATLIALEMSSHNWPLGRILTSTGGVDTDKATVVFTSRDNDDGTTNAPKSFEVTKASQGTDPWWIEAYDQAVTQALQANYGRLMDDELQYIMQYPRNFLKLFTGYSGDYTGVQKYSRRAWPSKIIEAWQAKSPVVIGTMPIVEPTDPNTKYALKSNHSYAIESITLAPNSDKDIATLTLRDAESATKGFTVTWEEARVNLAGVFDLTPYTGPGQ